MNSIKQAVDKCSGFFKGGSTISLETLKSQRKLLIIFYIVMITISVFTVYVQVLSYPRFSPEWSQFYKWNYNLSLNDLINLYNPFNLSHGQMFFRPTAFVTFYQITTKFIDWHNIFAFQIVGIIIFVINSFFVYCFTKQIFKDAVTPILTSVLSFIHPVFFILIHNLFMTDFLYQIFILWFGILFCGNFLERKNAHLWSIAAFILYLLAITSKEQAIGLPVFLAGFMVLEFLFNKNTFTLRNKLFRYRLILSLLIIIITIFYVIIYSIKANSLQHAGEYRTGINYEIIMSNVLSGISWLSHIFLFNSKTWTLYRVHNTIVNNLYGFMVLLAVFYYILTSIIRKDRDEIHKLLTSLFFMIAFILLPFYSGGRPWHYALPAVAFLMLYSNFVSKVLEKITRKAVWLTCLCIIVIIPLSLSAINFSRDMDRVDEYFKLNTEALLNPPLPSSSIPKGSYIAYFPSQARWLYGGGCLFSFVYKRNDINEIPIPDMDNITSDAALDLLSKENLFYFDYDKKRQPIWEDKSFLFRARLLDKISPDKRPLNMKSLSPPGTSIHRSRQ